MSGITCPEGYDTEIEPMPECTTSENSIANDNSPSSSFKGNFCSISGSGCLQLGPQVQNLMCVTDAQYNGGAPNEDNPSLGGLSAANTMAYPMFFDPDDNTNENNIKAEQTGSCIVGHSSSGYNCAIEEPGTYIYRRMRINYYVQDVYTLDNGRYNQNSVLFIRQTTRTIIPFMRYPADKTSNACYGSQHCQYELSTDNQYPCDGNYNVCKKSSTTTTTK